MTTFSDPGPTTVAGPKPPPTVLRGPSHADNYRIKVGRYRDRWYRDPLPYDALAPEALGDEAYPSVSIVKGASGKDWSYTTLKRIAQSDDLREIATKSFYERYERFKVINSLDLSAAQRRGTNVHTWAECLAYGVTPTLLPTDPGGNYFPMVDKLWAELQPELVAAEIVAFHRTLNGVGYGGTADGIFQIDGKLYMVDWKSRGEDSDHGAYPEEAGQIGGYTGADYVIVEDDDPSNPHGAKRIPMPQLDGGLIISIKPDSYEVYPVDLGRAQDRFEAMHAWWVARRDENKTIGSKWAPRRAVVNPLSLPKPEGEPPTPIPNPETLDADLGAIRREALYARLDALGWDRKAEFGDRVTLIDATDLDAVEALLDEIEHPPTVRDMARERMAADAEREADRRLSLEGGTANPDDVKVFEVTWELGLTAPGRKWIGKVVQEAVDAKCDFRLSTLNTKRRCDIYCALTEWCTVDEFDWNHDEAFRAVLATASVAPPPDLLTAPLGLLVGTLTTLEAAALRHTVTEIAAQRMTFVIEPDVPPRWELA